MTGKGPSIKDLTHMINNVMGQNVLTERQLNHILQGAKKAGEQKGMSGVLDYLMHVTQADVSKEELQQFANTVRSNPQVGKEMLEGKKRHIPRRRPR